MNLKGYRIIATHIGAKIKTRTNSLGRFAAVFIPELNIDLGGMSVFPKQILVPKYKAFFDLQNEMANDKELIESEHLIVNKVPEIKDGEVHVTCYGTTEKWDSREKALAFYKKGVASCEGSERDRYLNIVVGLENGETYVSDMR